jgi:hypothetical protein
MIASVVIVRSAVRGRAIVIPGRIVITSDR